EQNVEPPPRKTGPLPPAGDQDRLGRARRNGNRKREGRRALAGSEEVRGPVRRYRTDRSRPDAGGGLERRGGAGGRTAGLVGASPRDGAEAGRGGRGAEPLDAALRRRAGGARIALRAGP